MQILFFYLFGGDHNVNMGKWLTNNSSGEMCPDQWPWAIEKSFFVCWEGEIALEGSGHRQVLTAPCIFFPSSKSWTLLQWKNAAVSVWLGENKFKRPSSSWYKMEEFHIQILENCPKDDIKAERISFQYLMWSLEQKELNVGKFTVKRNPSPEDILVQRKKSNLVIQCEDYFRDHLSERITIKNMATELHCSAVGIHLAFKRRGGPTAMEMLMDMRMQKARNDVEKGDQPFQLIAQEIGFADSAGFSRCYRKRYGRSPREARQQAQWLS